MAYVIDQANCSCCHVCRIHCPVNAIHFKNAKYWIDKETCISCGMCAKVCHNGCISLPGQEKKIEVPEQLEYDCDVCVIGGGAAGMVAAAKAVDLGRRVVVLEKNHEIGGSAWYACGFNCHYSKIHEQAGVPDRRAAEYARFVEKLGDQVDTKLLARLFEANREFVDWMIDEHGLLDDYDVNPGSPIPMATMSLKTRISWNDKRIDGMIGPGGGGWLITSKLERFLKEKKVPVLCNTRATHLLTEGEAVVGVAAMCGDTPITVRSRSVIVASGAFTRNKAIMDRMQPMFYEEKPGREPIHIFTCSTCTGDGITMCEEIGADIDYKNRRVNMLGPMRHPYPGVSLNMGNGPMFDSRGQRYIDVPMKEISPMAYHERYLWKISNEENVVRAIEQKIASGTDMVGVNLNHFLANWRGVVQEEMADNSIVMADTLEELAEKLGYDKDEFAGEIVAYNRELISAQDRPKETPPAPEGMDMDAMAEMMALFAGPKALPMESGPYYAIKMKTFHENAIGGMTIDSKARVLRNGNPIAGLYAAGDTTRGIMVSGDIGVSYIEGVFSALTVAFNSGYIAGVEASDNPESAH